MSDDVFRTTSVRRLAANVLVAEKRFHLTEGDALTLEVVKDVMSRFSVDTLKRFYLSGRLSLKEFEALTDHVIRQEHV